MADAGPRADESTDNWTADITRDSIDTRLSSCNGLDDIDGRPSRSSVQSRDRSRDTIDVFESSGTILSSTDELDDARLSSTKPNRYFQQFSQDSADLIASSGMSDRRTTEALSLGSMSVELADVSEADDEHKRKEKAPKKKKSVFQRVRERLRATFSRDDRSRVSQRAEKYMHANGKASRQNWLTASFRRKKKKHHGDENGSVSASNYPVTNWYSDHHTVDRRQTYRDQPKSKGLLSSLQRRFSSIHNKRSQSRASGRFG